MSSRASGENHAEFPLSTLERAVVTLLNPLVRILLKRGVAFGQFAELAKQAYVEVARRDFAVPARKLTVSYVAVLTGLTRKEASRLLHSASPDKAENPRRRINRAARVFSAWVEDGAYLDGRGAPASLALESDSGPSFRQLVLEHGGDVTPRAVLDELVRVGAIRRLKDGRVRPVERAYIPFADEGEKLAILGSDVADLVATIDHNLDASAESAHFQRKVAYDNLRGDCLPALHALVRQEGQALLEKLNAEMSKNDLDLHPSSDGGEAHRAMVGIYYLEEEANDDS